MDKSLVYDDSKCTGCSYCNIACTFSHKGLFGTSGSLIKIITNEKAMLHKAMFCHHCKMPTCMDLCTFGAITKNSETGLVSVDSGECVGCGECMKCPLGGMQIDKESQLALNCDLCDGKPACVRFCPTGALQYSSPKEGHRIETPTVQPTSGG